MKKNTIYDRLKTWINCIHVFSSAHFLKADLYITAFIFPFFVPVFLLSGATTLEWSPSRAFRRAASCFGTPESFRVPQNTTCHVRLNMNFSVEKSKYGVPSTSRLKNTSAAILITFWIPKTGVSGALGRCNRMTYSVTDRQQTAMIVPIQKIYRYFAACQHVFGSSIIQVCVRYMVYDCLKPSGNGWTGICKNIIRQPFLHVWMRDRLNVRPDTWGIGYMTGLPVGCTYPSDNASM